MARVREVRDVELDALVIGRAQVRVREVGKEIDELAESIRVNGLLEPIVVCPADTKGKFEIITGQRRFLAHKKLGCTTISAAILDERVDETTAKVLSLTENLVRRDLNSRDIIDACTSLYKKYGSVKDVAEETGLPYPKVAQYVKFDRLLPELKDLVTRNEVGLQVALRAQDAASVAGAPDPEEAVKFAKEMSGMSGAQQARIVEARQEEPEASADKIIEEAKTQKRITQIVVTLGVEAHRALQDYARDAGTNQDDAASTLLSEALAGKGFLKDLDR